MSLSWSEPRLNSPEPGWFWPVQTGFSRAFYPRLQRSSGGQWARQNSPAVRGQLQGKRARQFTWGKKLPPREKGTIRIHRFPMRKRGAKAAFPLFLSFPAGSQNLHYRIAQWVRGKKNKYRHTVARATMLNLMLKCCYCGWTTALKCIVFLLSTLKL